MVNNNRNNKNNNNNADNEDNLMDLREEEWEDLFGYSMEIASFNGFSCESSNEDDIDIN